MLTIGDEDLKAFSMSFLGDTSDYQWKEFQGLVRSCRLLNWKKRAVIETRTPVALIKNNSSCHLYIFFNKKNNFAVC